VKRFAVVKDREFEIGGEVFEWIVPYWEDISAVFDRDATLDETNGGLPTTVRGSIEDLIERVKLFLKLEDQERWVKLAHRRENPIPHWQYAELYRWLLETASSTPTEQSSPSEDGQPQTVAT
jgi:hypothetical protein